MEELFAEQVDAQDGKGSEQDRPELQSGDSVAEDRDGECLKIDEKPFAAEVGRIEDVKGSGLERVYGIDTVGGFVRIDAGGDVLDMIDADEECQKQDEGEDDPGNETGFVLWRHIVFCIDCLWPWTVKMF